MSRQLGGKIYYFMTGQQSPTFLGSQLVEFLSGGWAGAGREWGLVWQTSQPVRLEPCHRTQQGNNFAVFITFKRRMAQPKLIHGRAFLSNTIPPLSTTIYNPHRISHNSKTLKTTT